MPESLTTVWKQEKEEREKEFSEMKELLETQRSKLFKEQELFLEKLDKENKKLAELSRKSIGQSENSKFRRSLAPTTDITALIVPYVIGELRRNCEISEQNRGSTVLGEGSSLSSYWHKSEFRLPIRQKDQRHLPIPLFSQSGFSDKEFNATEN